MVKQKILIFISSLALAIGIVIMLYPAVSSIINAKNQSQVIDGYVEKVESFSDGRIESLWKQAVQYNKKLKNSTVVMTDPFDEEAVKITSQEYEDTLNIDETGLMAFIDISKLGCIFPFIMALGNQCWQRQWDIYKGRRFPLVGRIPIVCCPPILDWRRRSFLQIWMSLL